MEARNDTFLALERVVSPAAGHPAWPETEQRNERLNITVIFTSVEATLAALRRAGALAGSLGARITLLALQVVPFPLPLESPPVLLDWNERRFRTIAGRSPVETTVRLYLCRDRIETVKSALGANSVIVIGGTASWWPFTAEKRLARALRRAGHEIVFAETE